MIISCPHCQTKYQVAFEAIGSAGRKVRCAQCRRAWDQQPIAPEPEPDHDYLFDAMEEDALDEILMAEAQAVAGEAKPIVATKPQAAAVPDAAELRKRQAAFSRRQSVIGSRLPLARLRRAARTTGLLFVAGIVAGGYFWRAPIVERYPDLAGVYEAVGLGVNVVGLDFSDLKTLKTLSNGKDVLLVSAQIVGLSSEPRPVPPVVVSLLDAGGHAVYEWSVVPRVVDLMAGERATFDTRLSLPPSQAMRVRLSFAGGNGGEGQQPGGHAEPEPGQIQDSSAAPGALPSQEPPAPARGAAPANH